jgi:hypothetical protein
MILPNGNLKRSLNMLRRVVEYVLGTGANLPNSTGATYRIYSNGIFYRYTGRIYSVCLPCGHKFRLQDLRSWDHFKE